MVKLRLCPKPFDDIQPWLHDGSCVRLRAEYSNHGWSYDFVHDRTSDSRFIRILTIIDEYTREALAVDVERRMSHSYVLDRLADLFIERGVPEYIRSDNGSEFISTTLRKWLKRVNVILLCIEPGSPWENGYLEAKILTERWRKKYNQIRPHSLLGYRPTAPQAVILDC